MRVKFKVNLGSVDAEPLKLDWHDCKVGAEVKVSSEAGKWLIENGIAESLDAKVSIEAVPSAAAIEGVPKRKEKHDA